MLYKQDIANLALGHLGVSQSVMDFENERTTHAIILRRHFRMSLDTLLEKYEWSFATQYAALPLLEELSTLGGKYAYTLPADCLVVRVLAMDGAFPQVKQYEREKMKWREVYNGVGPRKIITDIPRAHVEYTVRLDEGVSFPTHFGRGLSHQLALDIAPALITNNFPKVRQVLLATAMNEISAAIAADLGRQPQLEDSPSPFISARLG
jgi:hypothetical protein